MAGRRKQPRWVRDGTILSGHTEIDLRDTKSRYRTWITIKASDKIAEKLATRLLKSLNSRTV